MAKSDDTERKSVFDEALELYETSVAADSINRENQREDIKFIKMREQWPESVRRQREEDGRPCLTIDQLGPVVRQVVNDCRLNKPEIKVKPVDSHGDPKTAEIIGGLIKNIEYTSNADVAYDTAVDYAVSSSRGYMRVSSEYATDDAFEQDLVIQHVADPLTIIPDVYSTAADSSDWNYCFVLERVTRADYAKRFRGKEVVDWSDLTTLTNDWFGDDCAMIAEYWKRVEVPAWVAMLSNGETQKFDEEPSVGDMVEEGVPLVDPMTGEMAIDPMTGEVAWQEEPVTVLAVRETKSYKVTQYILSGKQILDTVEWPGKFIPIVPVYGEDFVYEGRRYFVSLVRPAMDAQRMKNYWRSTSTELVALAPRAPWVGNESAFQGEDAAKWETANSENHAFLSVPDGHQLPQRQTSPTIPAGALQEAANATDDIKTITGVYDASLGARSNETSGRAIMARQREGDVSTFNFIDNLSRAIRHLGRIIVDLIPHYYSVDRMIRIINPDGEPESVHITTPEQMQEYQAKVAQSVEQMEKVYSLGVGKYDVAVESGPATTTQRQEANEFFVSLIQAVPQYADIIAPFALKTFDAPGVTDLVKEIEARMQQQQQAASQPQQPTPEDQMKMQEAQAKLQAQQQKDQQDFFVKQEELRIDAFKAETDRISVTLKAREPTETPRVYGA